ncbi:MAG: cupin-like domain-containing protein [Alteromonadaceae bacterium]|nr:cupin-like domain-containing protein [Alteromonadaceae bacterium]
MKQSKEVRSIRKVSDHSKSDRKEYEEKGSLTGNLIQSTQEKEFHNQGDLKGRLAAIGYDFYNKRVLDVGCSIDSLLHTLAGQITSGVGIVANDQSVNNTNALKAMKHTNNIQFYTFDLDNGNLSVLRDFLFATPVDVCFFINLVLCVKRWKQVFRLCAEQSTTMLFEVQGSEEQQTEQLNFIQSIYTDIRLSRELSGDDLTYAKRQIYICKHRSEKSELCELPDNLNLLKNYSKGFIKQTYEQVFNGEYAESIHFYPKNKVSVVVDINSEYIVKFPRSNFGVQGLYAEQEVTDFIRNKVQLGIPDISIHEEPVVLGRYPKLPGKSFAQTHYEQLSEQTKANLAEQLAQFMADMHVIPLENMKQTGIEKASSWKSHIDFINQHLAEENDDVIKTLLLEVENNKLIFNVSDDDLVFGHFDLQSRNILLNGNHQSISGIIDFGQCKIGDLHQDLSVMNLSSPELAKRTVLAYVKITKRKLNHEMIQHFTTMYYLNLLAELKRNKAGEKYEYWLGELHKWYGYVIDERANTNFKNCQPVSSLTQGWQKWIAINFENRATLNGLPKVLTGSGFSYEDAVTALRLAHSHSITGAGHEVGHHLNKREWLFKTCHSLASIDPCFFMQIDVRDTPDFSTFINVYYSKNSPVVLQKGIEHWPALKKWQPSYFLDHFGELEIEVQFGQEQYYLHESNVGQFKKTMTMRNYIESIEKGGRSNHYYLTPKLSKNSPSGISLLFDDIADFGQGYRTLKAGNTGASLWFGPKGTYTPVHYDLTNSMLVQIYGCKKVTLIPAWQVPYLYNNKGVFSVEQFANIDREHPPSQKNIIPVEVIFGPGDAVFIPRGWWHCVESLDVSISVVLTDFNEGNNGS